MHQYPIRVIAIKKPSTLLKFVANFTRAALGCCLAKLHPMQRSCGDQFGKRRRLCIKAEVGAVPITVPCEQLVCFIPRLGKVSCTQDQFGGTNQQKQTKYFLGADHSSPRERGRGRSHNYTSKKA